MEEYSPTISDTTNAFQVTLSIGETWNRKRSWDASLPELLIKDANKNVLR